jgi:hypothetical protein
VVRIGGKAHFGMKCSNKREQFGGVVLACEVKGFHETGLTTSRICTASAELIAQKAARVVPEIPEAQRSARILGFVVGAPMICPAFRRCP